MCDLQNAISLTAFHVCLLFLWWTQELQETKNFKFATSFLLFVYLLIKKRALNTFGNCQRPVDQGPISQSNKIQFVHSLHQPKTKPISFPEHMRLCHRGEAFGNPRGKWTHPDSIIKHPHWLLGILFLGFFIFKGFYLVVIKGTRCLGRYIHWECEWMSEVGELGPGL